MQIAFDDDGDEDDDYAVCACVCFRIFVQIRLYKKRIAIVSKCTANDRAADVRYFKPTTAKHCKKKS